MSVISLFCPGCGDSLKVDADKDANICNSCGKLYIIKDAIAKNCITSATNITADKAFDIKDCELVKYNGEDSDVIIPDNVKIIGNGAFRNSKIESFTLPQSVRIIDEYAFQGCMNVKEVIIPDGVEIIRPHAFQDCSSLTKIVLPSTIKEFGVDVFKDCHNLSELDGNFNPEMINFNQKNIVPCIKNLFVESPLGKFILKDRVSRNVCPYCGGQYKGKIFPMCIRCYEAKDLFTEERIKNL